MKKEHSKIVLAIENSVAQDLARLFDSDNEFRLGLRVHLWREEVSRCPVLPDAEDQFRWKVRPFEEVGYLAGQGFAVADLDDIGAEDTDQFKIREYIQNIFEQGVWVFGAGHPEREEFQCVMLQSSHQRISNAHLQEDGSKFRKKTDI